MRQLIIDENFLKFENKDHSEDLFTLIPKEEISGLRYGVHFIRGYKFYIGREYQIFLRTKSGKELKIYFKLFYRRKLQQKHQLFTDIVEALWKEYFDKICEDYLTQIKNNKEIKIGKVSFNKNTISFNKKQICFDDLELKKYVHYFVISSRKDAYCNIMLYHLQDQDAVIIYNLVTTIIQNEQFRTEEISDRKV